MSHLVLVVFQPPAQLPATLPNLVSTHRVVKTALKPTAHSVTHSRAVKTPRLAANYGAIQWDVRQLLVVPIRVVQQFATLHALTFLALVQTAHKHFAPFVGLILSAI